VQFLVWTTSNCAPLPGVEDLQSTLELHRTWAPLIADGS
jgi:hypothetical protein